MRRPRAVRSTVGFAFAVIAAASTISTTPAQATVTGGVLLPVPRVSAFLVDPTSGHLLYGSGSAQNGLLVTAGDGTVVSTLLPTAGINDLALSADGRSVLAASVNTDTVFQIDLTTLAVTKTFALPGAECPESVAAVSDRYVAIGYTCDAQWGGVGVLDLTTGGFSVETAYDPFHQPTVRTVPNTSQVLVVDTALSSSRAAVFAVGSGTPVAVRQVSALAECSNAREIAVSPDATTFAAACGWPYRQLEFSLADFTEKLSHATNPYPTSVAFTTDGSLLAAGMDGQYANDVALFHHTAADASQVYALDLTDSSTAYPTTVAHGVAFGPGGTTLYALGGNPSSNQVWLYALPGSSTAIARPSSSLTLTAPAAAPAGNSVTFTGSLRFSDNTTGAAAAGKSVQVTSTLNGVASSATVVTDVVGGFTYTTTSAVPGALTATATYAGDALHAGGSASAVTQVGKRVPMLTISASAPKCSAGTVLAHLGTTATNRTVTIKANGATIASGRVNGSGDLSASYRLRGRTTFTASFSGDARYAAAQATTTLC